MRQIRNSCEVEKSYGIICYSMNNKQKNQENRLRCTFYKSFDFTKYKIICQA